MTSHRGTYGSASIGFAIGATEENMDLFMPTGSRLSGALSRSYERLATKSEVDGMLLRIAYEFYTSVKEIRRGLRYENVRFV